MLGFKPNKINLYRNSFKHKSYDRNDNYERLEFLGDAILNSIVSEHLFKNKSNEDEGFLSKKRSEIISRKNLNKTGKKIIPNNKIKHKLEFLTENIYGNIIESVIAAIYLDKGYETSKKFVKKHIILGIDQSEIKPDYKSKILEWSHKKEKSIEFINLKQKGPDHKKKYLVQLMIDNQKICDSWGKTKKSAEQKVSRIAYKNIC